MYLLRLTCNSFTLFIFKPKYIKFFLSILEISSNDFVKVLSDLIFREIKFIMRYYILNIIDLIPSISIQYKQLLLYSDYLNFIYCNITSYISPRKSQHQVPRLVKAIRGVVKDFWDGNEAGNILDNGVGEVIRLDMITNYI